MVVWYLMLCALSGIWRVCLILTKRVVWSFLLALAGLLILG